MCHFNMKLQHELDRREAYGSPFQPLKKKKTLKIGNSKNYDNEKVGHKIMTKLF